MVVVLLLIVVKRKGKEGLVGVGRELEQHFRGAKARAGRGRGRRSNKYQFVRQKAGSGGGKTFFQKRFQGRRMEIGKGGKGGETDSSPFLSAYLFTRRRAAGKRNGGK